MNQELTDYAVDVIAMVCMHVHAPSEKEALQRAVGVQGASLEDVTLPDGITATELSVRHVSAIPYANKPGDKAVPVAYTRTDRAVTLARLADACEQASAEFRAISDSESATFDDENEAAMDMASTVDRLVEEVRELLANVDPDVL